MKINWKIILAVIVVIGIIGAATAYLMFNKPHRVIAEEDADYTLTADELYAQYTQNDSAANAKFLDKVVKVSGTIEDITTNQEGKTALILTASDAMIGGINATIQNDEADAAEFETGEQITLKCRCTGMLMDVVLTNCSVVR